MAQITLYLDPQTHQLLDQASRASGMSKSRWLSMLIQKYANQQWPLECLELAGAFKDFPLQEDIDILPQSADIPRIGF